LDPLERWGRVRQEHLRNLYPENSGFSFADSDHDLLTNSDALRAAERITLWIGTGLAEQLLLVWVVELLRLLSIDLTNFRIVQFTRTSRGSEIVSVGALKPSEFREHPDQIPLDDADLRELSAAWRAVTAATPEALLAFLAGDEHLLPFMRRSLFALFYRYPDQQTGVNAWEYQLLRHTREKGPKAARVIGHTMAHDMEFPDWVNDGYLFQRLQRLADPALPKPMLRLSGDLDTLRETEVHLTARGQDVLSGKGNFIEWNGIDDWVGNVHLDSKSVQVWFHVGRTLTRGGEQGRTPHR
jgi:hypothetical protein